MPSMGIIFAACVCTKQSQSSRRLYLCRCLLGAAQQDDPANCYGVCCVCLIG
jgi:hypothetical protein